MNATTPQELHNPIKIWMACTTWTKKKKKEIIMLLMNEIRLLWYRGIRALDSAAEPRANATCDCRDFTHWCIAAKSDCRFFDSIWCIAFLVCINASKRNFLLLYFKQLTNAYLAWTEVEPWNHASHQEWDRDEKEFDFGSPSICLLHQQLLQWRIQQKGKTFKRTITHKTAETTGRKI